MEIRRFGPGHRRPEGPPGTRGLTGQVIHSGPEGSVAEFAFSRYGMIPPHANPHRALFVVISGAGFVQVGEERSSVNHGEAVVWPANVMRGAYTDGVEMRAIVIEFPDQGDEAAVGLLDVSVGSDRPGAMIEPANRADADAPIGSAPRPPTEWSQTEAPAPSGPRPAPYDESQGEPW